MPIRDAAQEAPRRKTGGCHVSFGGKERTADEFGKLLSDSGLKLEQITSIEDGFLAILEASRAS
jgi:hypothetical protein